MCNFAYLGHHNLRFVRVDNIIGLQCNQFSLAEESEALVESC